VARDKHPTRECKDCGKKIKWPHDYMCSCGGRNDRWCAECYEKHLLTVHQKRFRFDEDGSLAGEVESF